MTETTGNPGTVVLAAANGFLGRSLAKALKAQGYRVVGLVRHGREADAPGCDALRVWDGRTLGDWAQALDGAAAVVNLAGRTVDCIKTPENRRQILESRVDSVRVIGQACRAVPTPPPVWLQAGTAHIIGDPIPEDTLCDDDTPPPTEGLAPEVGRAWEQAFDDALLPGQRGVQMRMSFVLGARGGALQQLATLARLGLGGTVGHGRQWMSWVHEHDMNRLWLAALTDEAYRGAYMATAPEPVTNRVFMRELRRACRRPWSPPAPARAVRFGARFLLRTDPELALLGRRIVPSRLIADHGFRFDYPEIGPALRHLLRSGAKTG